MPRRPRLAPVFHIDDLACYCWCDTTIVHVHRSVVLAGETVSCGRPRCKGPA